MTAEATSKKGSKKGSKKDGEQKGRVAYNYAKAIAPDGSSLVNEKGKLVGLPVFIPGETPEAPKQEAYDPRKHKPLKPADFATQADFLDHRAWVLGLRISSLGNIQKKLAEKADRFRKFGDEETRKKAEKLARMREQMAALEKELEGKVDLD